MLDCKVKVNVPMNATVVGKTLDGTLHCFFLAHLLPKSKSECFVRKRPDTLFTFLNFYWKIAKFIWFKPDWKLLKKSVLYISFLYSIL